MSGMLRSQTSADANEILMKCRFACT